MKPPIKQAMILAAGLGKRLHPLTLSTPKPLLRVGDIPLIQRAIDSLCDYGVERIVINTHYLGDQIRSYIDSLSLKTPQIFLSEEPILLETGGGIAHATPYFLEGPLLCLNSDIWWQDNTILHRLWTTWEETKMDALLALVPHERAASFNGPGDFFMGDDNHLIPRGTTPRAPYIYSGIQLIHPDRLLQGYSGAFSLSNCYNNAASKHRLFGIELQGTWSDLGTLKALEAIRLSHNKSIEGCRLSPENQGA